MERPALICSHVFEDTRPILLVSHEDGVWQFLCGAGDHPSEEVPRVCGMNHLLDRDESLKEILDLPENWDAERTDIKSPWRRIPSPR